MSATRGWGGHFNCALLSLLEPLHSYSLLPSKNTLFMAERKKTSDVLSLFVDFKLHVVALNLEVPRSNSLEDYVTGV